MGESVVMVNFYNPGVYNPISTKYIEKDELESIEDFCIPEGTKLASIRKGVMHVFIDKKEEKINISPEISKTLLFYCNPIETLEVPYECILVINVNLDP